MKFNIGLLGCGHVGSGVYEILNSNEYLKKYAKIAKVLVKDITKPREGINSKLLTDNIDDILNDESINLVIEVIGGGTLAYEAMKKALMNKKHVITANKEVLSTHLNELLDIAHKNNVYLMFEASVGGGVPIVRTIINNAKTNQINHIKGIINGSTNFLMSLIQQMGYPYEKAFKEASRLGYLEADPTADVYGYDPVRKIVVLSTICFKGDVSIDHAYTYPISKANDQFIIYINNKNYVLKYLAEAYKQDNMVSIRVEPTIVKKDNIFAMVNKELNIIQFNGENTGVINFIGKGAGKMPTANAVISDLVEIIEDRAYVEFENSQKLNVCYNDLFFNKYLIQTEEELPEDLIEYNDGLFHYTKKISARQLEEVTKNAIFYAKIEE